MDINKDIRRLFVVAMVIIVAYMAGLATLYSSFHGVMSVHDNRLLSLNLAEETSRTSAALTASVRDYIASGIAKY